jgi:L-ribulose-5-phosphate 3-epimerase
MSTNPSRRDLLIATTSLSALAISCKSSPTEEELAQLSDPYHEGFFGISLAQWSNHRALRGGELSNLEWISSVREKYDVDAIEFVNSFFKDKAMDWGYLDEMKQRAADADTRMLLIMIDGEGSLAAQDANERAKAIENHRKWILSASYLGCHSIRVNAAGSGEATEMAKRAADSLDQLAHFGEPFEVSVIVENHGGRSSNGQWLASVMELASNPGVGTLPDFGNFNTGGGVWYDRYLGVQELMPYAKAVSAKSHDFDALGNEVNTDYTRMLQIVKDSGYTGYIGIEYEGSKLSEDDGIRMTRDLLIRVRKSLG